MIEFNKSDYPKMVPRTNSVFLKVLANIVTFVFHPVFMPTVVTIMLYRLNVVSFDGAAKDDLANWLSKIVFNTLFFPLFFVGLCKALGFMSSIRMFDPKDRIIPLIGTMVFYFWTYDVFSNINAPFLLRVLLLDSFWGVIVVFMVNIFFKISIHTMAAGSVLGMVLILMFFSPISMTLPFFICLLIAGAIGTARLLLGAHTQAQVYAGYVLGILVQLAAYAYLK